MGDMQVGENNETPEIKVVYPVRRYSQVRKPLAKRLCEKPKQHLWDDRTKLERALLILFTIAAIVLSALAITVHVLQLRDVTAFCSTKDCVAAGNYILKSIDQRRNPCDDFYKFACGRFLEESIAPEKTSQMEDITSGFNLFSIRQDVFNARVLNILRKRNASDPKSLWQARSYFDSCMNLQKINKEGIRPLKDVLKKFGGWPVLESQWKEKDFAWENSVADFASKGLDSSMFMQLNTIEDDKNIGFKILSLDKPLIGYPHEQEMKYQWDNFNDTDIVSYYHFMVNTSVFFGANRTIAEMDYKDVLKFEAKLVSLKHADISITSENTGTISSLHHSVTSDFNWIKFFGRLIPTQVTGSEKVYVESPTFLKKLLKAISDTSKRTIANYMMWHIVRNNLVHLGDSAKALANSYQTGRKSGSSQPRWLYCLNQVWSQMLSPAAMYIREYFYPNDKEKVTTIFNAIRDEILEIVKYHDGFDYEHRKKAVEEISGLDHFIFHDELLNSEELDIYYKDVVLNPDKFFDNLLQMRRFLQAAKFQEISYPRDKPHWSLVRYSLDLTEMQTPSFESVVSIPFTYIVAFNFDSDRPEYVNYATLGPVIANIIFTTLRDNTDDTFNILMNKKEQCEINDVGNVRGSHVNTIRASIAVASMQLAYKVYANWAYYNGEEKHLPGLRYTPSQMFWIVDATQMCGHYPKDSSFINYSKDRVNIPAAGLTTFADDFKCSSESEMNSKKKCDEW